MGFEQRADAERFLQEWKERLRKFGLELHPDKTRLIEFGRFAAEDRKRRGEGKPETFNFLGFTHICAKNQKTGGFSVDRKTIRKRLSAKLKAVREELRRRWHEPVAEVGKWLRSVVQGYFNYHAVPGNIDSLQSFRAQVVWHWSRALQRRSPKSRMPWERFGPLAARWIPSATMLHPRPAMGFHARYLRYESYAAILPVRICAGGPPATVAGESGRPLPLCRFQRVWSLTPDGSFRKNAIWTR